MRIGDVIDKGVRSVTKDWTTYRKKQYRNEARAARYHDEMMRGHGREKYIKEIAYEIMEEAFMKASGANVTMNGMRRPMRVRVRSLNEPMPG